MWSAAPRGGGSEPNLPRPEIMLRGLGRAAAVVTAGGCAGGAYFWYEYKSLPPVDSALQPGKTLTCKLLSVEHPTGEMSCVLEVDDNGDSPPPRRAPPRHAARAPAVPSS